MKTVNALPAAVILGAAMIVCTTLVISDKAGGSDTTDSPATTVAAIPEDPAATLDSRSQYTLVKQVAAARTNEDHADAQLAAVKSDWQGHRVRWEMRVVGPLCHNAEHCVVAPVDYNRFDERVVQGWLPHLELSKATHQRIKNACQKHRRCVLNFEAKIHELVLSTQQPTSMVLAEIEVIDARSATDAESWIKRKADPRRQRAMARR